MQWAEQKLHSINGIAHRIRRMYYSASPKYSCYPYSQRVIWRKKVYPLKMQSFMGIEIPRNMKETLRLDEKNKDKHWEQPLRPK